MTKKEFTVEAAKSGIRPELYGAVLAGQIRSERGYVSGGKVAGIEWLDTWKTEQGYNRMRGHYEETFLSKSPYVVLVKNKTRYLVETTEIKAYIDKLLGEWLDEKVKNNKPL